MKTPRRLPAEGDLRRAMERTVEAVVGQQRAGGVPNLPAKQDHEAFRFSAVGNVKAAEDFVRPIIEKIARTQDMDESPAPAVPSAERDADELARRGKVELKYQSTITRTPMGPLRERALPGKESSLTAKKRKRIQVLMGDPVWRDRVLSARFDKNGRVPWKKDAKGEVVEDTDRTDKQILEVLESSNALFGDWKKDDRPLVFAPLVRK